MGDTDELMEIFRSPEYGQMMSQMPESEQHHMSQQIDSFGDTAEGNAYLRDAIAFKNENPNTSLTTVDTNFQPLAPAADSQHPHEEQAPSTEHQRRHRVTPRPTRTRTAPRPTAPRPTRPTSQPPTRPTTRAATT